VQGAVEDALAVLAKHPVKTMGSGRTDLGVHAFGQVAHFDVLDGQKVLADDWLYRINSILPPDVACHKIYEVPADWHARFTAVARRYEYFVGLSKNPFSSHICTYLPSKGLDVESMHEAAQFLLGEHSFRSFSKYVPDEHYLCRMKEGKWEDITQENPMRAHGTVIKFTVEANRFLRGQVRSMVGAMLEIGRGKYPPEWLRDVLTAQQGQVPTQLAPAEGLCLAKVIYPSLSDT
jgi:tRNA pseudouridine38-40 synthase